MAITQSTRTVILNITRAALANIDNILDDRGYSIAKVQSIVMEKIMAKVAPPKGLGAKRKIAELYLTTRAILRAELVEHLIESTTHE